MISINIHKVFIPLEHELKVDLKLTNQSLGVFAPSGAGKTSFLRIIAGLLKPDAGFITFNEKVWLDTSKNFSLKPQQRNIGLVFQDYGLFPNLTAKENIYFSMTLENENRINLYTERLNLSSISHKYPHQLSGGQKQRIAILRTIASNPDLLLLDEPFSALDQKMKEITMQMILEWQKSNSKQIIIASHNKMDLQDMTTQLLEF